MGNLYKCGKPKVEICTKNSGAEKRPLVETQAWRRDP